MVNLLHQAVLLIYIASQVSTQVLECLVRSSDGVPMDKQPLYIKNNQLLYPDLVQSDSYLAVDIGTYLTLACPGTGNVIVGASQIENVSCVRDTTFLLRTTPTNLGYINCSATVRSAIQQTTRTCGPSGSRIIEVGFKLSRWYKLFETCHDNAGDISAYALHKVPALVLVGSQKNSDRPAFKKGLDTIYQGLDPDSLYKKVNQQDMMLKYLGTDEYFDSTKLFFSKGHLAPDADFIFSNWQFATYYYVNTAPQWFGLNSGNWLAIERSVRGLADSMGVDLEVATGTYGILELEDINGVLRPMYMAPDVQGIPVPRLFWKSVYDPATDAGIVLLMENNPFDQGTPLCRDICTAHGWVFYNSLERGMVYCCSQADLKTTIPYLPFGSASAILERS